MDEHHKNAYRFLLYWATLEIRPLEFFMHWGWWTLNPFCWWRQCRSNIRHVQAIGALAYWLHNLALFSCNDFEGFNEEIFWRESEYFNKKYPEFDYDRYRDIFDRRLQELRTGKWPS